MSWVLAKRGQQQDAATAQEPKARPLAELPSRDPRTSASSKDKRPAPRRSWALLKLVQRRNDGPLPLIPTVQEGHRHRFIVRSNGRYMLQMEDEEEAVRLCGSRIVLSLIDVDTGEAANVTVTQSEGGPREARFQASTDPETGRAPSESASSPVQELSCHVGPTGELDVVMTFTCASFDDVEKWYWLRMFDAGAGSVIKRPRIEVYVRTRWFGTASKVRPRSEDREDRVRKLLRGRASGEGAAPVGHHCSAAHRPLAGPVWDGAVGPAPGYSHPYPDPNAAPFVAPHAFAAASYAQALHDLQAGMMQAVQQAAAAANWQMAHAVGNPPASPCPPVASEGPLARKRRKDDRAQGSSRGGST